VSFDEPARDVAAWLKTPAGVAWSLSRIPGSIQRHCTDSGVFADVIADHGGSMARWPRPLSAWDLDNPGSWS
jgi:hypothetical protein